MSLALKILLIGGTRFVGKALVSVLKSKGHELTLFTRGKNPVPSDIEHLKGDRNNEEDLCSLRGRSFDVIVDSSGRTLQQTQLLLSHSGIPSHRFLYVSSAGVYATSHSLPIDEDWELDQSSRHIGKAETEQWLINESIPFTSFRPTYIYGPGNYNPIEKWFFDRITNNQPVPIPEDGRIITQLGHVNDLAYAMSLSLETSKARNRIYNCSGKKGITLLGLAYSAAIAANKDPNTIEIKKFSTKNLDSKARKLFPLRLEHFLTDTGRLERDLSWKENFDINKGLKDSYQNDYLLNRSIKPDFTQDEYLTNL